MFVVFSFLSLELFVLLLCIIRIPRRWSFFKGYVINPCLPVRAYRCRRDPNDPDHYIVDEDSIVTLDRKVLEKCSYVA